MLKIKLSRNLRKTVMQGHPWVYRNALILNKEMSSQYAQLLDQKGQPLAWGIYDSENDIGFRVLSTARKPVSKSILKQRFYESLSFRTSYFDANTNCFRGINGEGDNLPGLVVDIYDSSWVVQFDSKDLSDFWLEQGLWQWIQESPFKVECIIHKSRHLKKPEIVFGEPTAKLVVKENSCLFEVDLIDGQKTGFFLDQRQNRDHVAKISQGKSILNLFSYTGGFSVYAGHGGASQVTSVDISKGACQRASSNWSLNDFAEAQHQVFAEDVHEYLIRSKAESWDIVIVDPPSMAPSEAAKPQAIKKYIQVFSLAAKKVKTQGDLILSSCSSHISFDDFDEIITEVLSKVRRVAKVILVSGQGIDHPYPKACPELRYLKFVHLKFIEDHA